MNICHRDLKPGNLLLDEQEENIFIIDFGESKQYLQNIQENTKQILSVKGTPKYFSPELCQVYETKKYERLNPYKSDVFSLGLIILEMGMIEIPEKTKNILKKSDVGIKQVVKEGINYDKPEFIVNKITGNKYNNVIQKSVKTDNSYLRMHLRT